MINIQFCGQTKKLCFPHWQHDSHRGRIPRTSASSNPQRLVASYWICWFQGSIFIGISYQGTGMKHNLDNSRDILYIVSLITNVLMLYYLYFAITSLSLHQYIIDYNGIQYIFMMFPWSPSDRLSSAPKIHGPTGNFPGHRTSQKCEPVEPRGKKYGCSAGAGS
jgi:hypothetical protein